MANGRHEAGVTHYEGRATEWRVERQRWVGTMLREGRASSFQVGLSAS